MQKFGLFRYETYNLGDEIQSIAASQFLPRVDYLIDRDKTSHFKSDNGELVKVIMNAWYSHWPENWPPSSDIDPLLTSMHITSHYWSSSGTMPNKVMLQGAGLEFFKKYQPIGSRDLTTLALFRAAGVESYFSSCMTTTLQRPDVPRNENLILLNDVPDDIFKNIDLKNMEVEYISQITSEKNFKKRFSMAINILEKYAQANLVITSRLHCALPCLAFGTPVILITSAEDQTRFAGLDELLHVHSLENFRDSLPFDVRNPPSNKSEFKFYRKKLVDSCIDFIGSDFWSKEPGQFRVIRELIR